MSSVVVAGVLDLAWSFIIVHHHQIYALRAAASGSLKPPTRPDDARAYSREPTDGLYAEPSRVDRSCKSTHMVFSGFGLNEQELHKDGWGTGAVRLAGTGLSVSGL